MCPELRMGPQMLENLDNENINNYLNKYCLLINIMNYEGLYLIKEREFVRINEDVYKIGKSQHVLNRIKYYPKESMLHLVIFCKKTDDYEKELIKILINKFKLASRYGAEYFEGDLNKIILEIETFMKNKECIFCKVDNIMTHTVNEKTINTKNVVKTIYPMNEDNRDQQVDKNIFNLLDNYKGKCILHKCKICLYETNYKYKYDNHLLTKKHLIKVNKEKDKNDYNCIICNFNSINKNNYNKHLQTEKHKKNINKIDNDNNDKKIFELVIKLNTELKQKIESFAN